MPDLFNSKSKEGRHGYQSDMSNEVRLFEEYTNP